MVSRREWDYASILYFASIHIGGGIGMWYAFRYASASVIVFSVVYFFLGHLAITCGAHRLYSHESYVASRELQFALMLMFSIVAQGSIVWWVGKHRLHHAREDLFEDPHSPLHGFFHAHMGWLLTKTGKAPAPQQYMRHFYRDRGERYAPALWQHRHSTVLIVLMAFVVPMLVGFLFGDPWGGFLVGALARLVVQYHLTWIVNSVGHSYGIRKGKSKTATNIRILAPFTVGESHHANHHDDPGNYRLGRRWYDLDLGWAFIVGCMWCGLARERTRAE